MRDRRRWRFLSCKIEVARIDIILLNKGLSTVAKISASKSAAHCGKPAMGRPVSGVGSMKVVRRDAKSGDLVVSKARFEAVMQAAEQSGLLSEKSGRIGGRVSPALIRQAKRRTGIEADTDLIEFALATVALEDNFAATFKKSRGKVDPGLKLGF